MSIICQLCNYKFLLSLNFDIQYLTEYSFLFKYLKILEIEDVQENEEEEGTYFVDQAGHYYYQAKGETQPVMTMVPGLSDAGTEEGEEFIINQENDEEGAEEEGEDVKIL